MAKNIEAPADVEIASLRKHKEQQQARIRNLMEPGPGTPWEDRGSAGAIVGFFKTAFLAMFAPRRLLNSMRRPETKTDARILSIVYGVFWGISWVGHSVMSFQRSGREFELTYDGYGWALRFAMAVAATYFILEFASRLFYALASSGTMRAKFPPVLVYNVFVYCLGPSILAVIPFGIGPLVALVWILGLLIFGAVSRLAMKPGNAVVCVLIAFGGIVGAAVALYFILGWVVNQLGLFPEPDQGPAPLRLPGR